MQPGTRSAPAIHANGRNVPELARRYGMTERGMYKLIFRVRNRMREGA
ncbi:MAG: hypothetical protein IPH35_18990 [Rhodoferax sp.]|nr:hypothetical protein [Rhodoferax sp.]